MKLPKAKNYALEMVKGIRPGKVIANPIGRLHRLHVDAHEPMPEMAQVWAIETADYPPLYFRPLEELKAPNSDDYQLEYYPDGYPKLPACLRRNVAEGPAGGRASRLSNRKILSGNRTF